MSTYVQGVCALLILFFLCLAFFLRMPRSEQNSRSDGASASSGAWAKIKSKELIGAIIAWTCIVLGCHWLLNYLLPEVWTALAVKPFFWATHIAIALLVILTRKDKEEKGVKSKVIPGMAKLAIGILLLINLVMYTGPAKISKAKLDVSGTRASLEALMPDSPPRPVTRIESDELVVTAMPDNPDDPSKWTKVDTHYRQISTHGGEGKVLIKADNRPPVVDGRHVHLGRTGVIRLRSITGEPVVVTVTFH